MRKMRRIAAGILLFVLVCASMAGCGLKKATPEEIQAKFDAYCDELFAGIVATDPLSAHFMVADPGKYGVEFTEDDMNWGHASIDLIKQGYKNNAACLRDLKKYDRDSLTDGQKITYDTLIDYLEIQMAYEGSEFVNGYFSPINGLNANLSTNFIEYDFYDKSDVGCYLAMLADVDRYMDEIFEITREQAKEGCFLSDDNADSVIEQCSQVLDAEQEPLILTFEAKLDGLGLSDAEKEEYIKTNEAYVKEHYLPVYEKTIDLMKELKGSSNNDGGLCGYGDAGRGLYEAIVMDRTSSSMTPEELAKYLEEKTSDIIMQTTAIGISDYDAYEEFFAYEPDFGTPDEVLEFILEHIEKDFPKPATSNYTIEYQHESCEVDGVVAYYLLCRRDDISVNNIKVNRSAVEGDPLSLYTTLSHEGYPGHLYQHTALCANSEIHNIRKAISFVGYSEGWAQYASQCALDYLDTSDNVKKLIYLNEMLGYLVPARVDVGVNYEGWDMDDTYDYLKDFYEVDRNYDDENNFVRMVYNLATGDPGVYLSYIVGYIKMVDMRERAQEELGESFDAVEYHEWLMELGVTTFDVIDERFEIWLAAKKEV